MNVKIYTTRYQFPIARVAKDNDDPYGRFTWAWLDEHLTDAESADWWSSALEHAWEQLEEDVNAEGVFGHDVKVYSEGRSGGWAVVDGIDADDVEGWDAIALSRWAKFARIARETADDVPYQFLALVYHNVYLLAMQESRNKADHAQRFA